LRARLEEELKKIRVPDVLLQTIVTLINLGGQRLGLSEQTKDARDPEQTRVAIEAVRSLLPLLEGEAGVAAHLQPIRDALSQLQMAYAREVGAADQAKPATETDAQQKEPRQEQPPSRPKRSGLWVPPGSGE
jgi:hypothetical protein